MDDITEKNDNPGTALQEALAEEVREELLRHFAPDAACERLMLLTDVEGYLESCGIKEYPLPELRELLRAEGFAERQVGGRLHFVMGER